MNRDAFEQLVCAWLDDPQDAALRARLDAALQADPSRASVLAEWQRFDLMLRDGLPGPRDVDWDRLKVRIVAAVAGQAGAGGIDGELDAVLARLPGVEDRVDWSRFRQRVTAAIGRAASQLGGRRRRYRGLVGAAAGLAAAIALFFTLRPTSTTDDGTGGLVQVTIGRPRATADNGRGIAEVRVAIAPVLVSQPQGFFVIDPRAKAAPSAEAAGFY